MYASTTPNPSTLIRHLETSSSNSSECLKAESLLRSPRTRMKPSSSPPWGESRQGSKESIAPAVSCLARKPTNDPNNSSASASRPTTGSFQPTNRAESDAMASPSQTSMVCARTLGLRRRRSRRGAPSSAVISLYTVGDALYGAPLSWPASAPSTDSAPPPLMRRAIARPSASRWYSNPSPFWLPIQFMKKPTLECTSTIAPSISQPIPKAARRVRKPMMSSSPPPSSAAITRMVSTGGMPIFEKPWIVAPAPNPPHHPSTFWAPCATKTTPSASRMSSAATSLSVRRNRMFPIPAGNWECKASLNDSWNENYGLNAKRDGANIPLKLPAEKAVKFYYDHKTHWVTDNVNSVIVTVPGSYQHAIGCSGDWQPDCLVSWLEDPDGDGIYVFSASGIPAGDYETKATINESWAENYGAGGARDGANIKFTVPPDVQKMFFIYEANSHILTVSTHPPNTGDVKKAKAHWLLPDTIAWPHANANSYYLYYA